MLMFMVGFQYLKISENIKFQAESISGCIADNIIDLLLHD